MIIQYHDHVCDECDSTIKDHCEMTSCLKNDMDEYCNVCIQQNELEVEVELDDDAGENLTDESENESQPAEEQQPSTEVQEISNEEIEENIEHEREEKIKHFVEEHESH